MISQREIQHFLSINGNGCVSITLSYNFAGGSNFSLLFFLLLIVLRRHTFYIFSGAHELNRCEYVCQLIVNIDLVVFQQQKQVKMNNGFEIVASMEGKKCWPTIIHLPAVEFRKHETCPTCLA